MCDEITAKSWKKRTVCWFQKVNLRREFEFRVEKIGTIWMGKSVDLKQNYWATSLRKKDSTSLKIFGPGKMLIAIANQTSKKSVFSSAKSKTTQNISTRIVAFKNFQRNSEDNYKFLVSRKKIWSNIWDQIGYSLQRNWWQLPREELFWKKR